VLSLVLVFGSVFSSSSSFPLPNIAFAADMDDMGGDSSGVDSSQGGDSGGDGEDSNDDDSSDGMPKDAPQTTGALTAGGDSDNDDDDNDSAGGDNDEDNNNDNEPTSEDAPVTTDTVTTQKKECPKGQEVTLFSTSCEPAGGADNTQAPTLDPKACPTSPTPTSYYVPDDLSIMNTVWGYNTDDYKVNTEKPDRQRFHLHWMASPVVPGVSVDKLLSDPSLRSLCTGKPVTVVSPDKKSATTYDPDGTKYVVDLDSLGDPVQMTEFDSKGNKTMESNYDPATGKLTYTQEYDPRWVLPTTSTGYNPQTGKPDWISKFDHDTNIAIETLYDPETNKPTKITKNDPLGRRETVTNIDPNSGKPKITEEYYIGPFMKAPIKLSDTTYVPGTNIKSTVIDFDRAGNPRMKIDYNPDTGLPSTTTTFNPTTGKPDMQIRFKEDGVTPDGPALHYDEDGNLKSK
jgi:hypothetical protein